MPEQRSPTRLVIAVNFGHRLLHQLRIGVDHLFFALGRIAVKFQPYQQQRNPRQANGNKHAAPAER
ncbi:hypothetical protein SRABI106_02978 [Rahnella aquatilis]|nr:hypothetical protein SRABI106_02978 [Rahnella aquatilis]